MTKWIRSLQKDAFNEKVAFQNWWNLFLQPPNFGSLPAPIAMALISDYVPNSQIHTLLHLLFHFSNYYAFTSPQFAPKDLKELILLNDTHYMQIANISKCQLISKCPFGVFKSPKNQKNFFGFLPQPLKRGQIKKIRALYTAN